MGFHFPGTKRSSFGAKMASSKSGDVPKGYVAVYIGHKMKRFVIPISYLNQPSFQELLSQAEEEFGYDYVGAITIPCREESQKSKHYQMGFRLLGIKRTSFMSSARALKSVEVPKCYYAVYVEERMKHFVIPISYLNQPSFQDFLTKAGEEFGYSHPIGGLTIPCREDVFLDITSRFNGL
ncbi:auxin-induced protein X10A-like [Prosopis cineraria]|uniref:auxin-induced protein X10A-like n=1 Tax=Prosopis cineraria TaxID=364024 RepID=UPI00240EBF5B|nr:auxin-induced protein X10A-like [Prosopis cineraria]